MNLIHKLLQKNKKIHFSLIDPDTQDPKEAGRIAKVCEDYGTNAIMVGGTTISNRKIIYDTVDAIKKNVKLPVILFPNSANSISENLDYIFFMMLLNSKEMKYITGEQFKGAPLVKKWGIEPISMGYIIISTSKKPTTVEKHVKLDKIHSNDINKAVDYACRVELLGMSCIYLDAGSGAEKPISNEMIEAVDNAIDIPIIIGGGIRNGDTAKEKIDVGADAIVTGTVIEKNMENIEDIIKKIHNSS